MRGGGFRQKVLVYLASTSSCSHGSAGRRGVGGIPPFNVYCGTHWRRVDAPAVPCVQRTCARLRSGAAQTHHRSVALLFRGDCFASVCLMPLLPSTHPAGITHHMHRHCSRTFSLCCLFLGVFLCLVLFQLRWRTLTLRRSGDLRTRWAGRYSDATRGGLGSELRWYKPLSTCSSDNGPPSEGRARRCMTTTWRRQRLQQKAALVPSSPNRRCWCPAKPNVSAVSGFTRPLCVCVCVCVCVGVWVWACGCGRVGACVLPTLTL